MHTQNACTRSAIRWGYGSRAAAPALPGRRSSTPAASPTPPSSCGISQAAVSRTLLSLEQILGVRLLHRTSRSVTPTTAGVQVLARARQLLAEADDLVREATTGHTRLRIGHAWSAMGRHTAEFQRRWARAATRTSNCS